MQTDIVLRSKSRTIVIDTKYYLEAFQHYLGAKEVRSDHLYQILAYLQNLAPTLAPDHLREGILLYPAIADDCALQYDLLGYPITVRSINLNQPWHHIHGDFLQIAAGAHVAQPLQISLTKGCNSPGITIGSRQMCGKRFALKL